LSFAVAVERVGAVEAANADADTIAAIATAAV
jgi:hypothetical protein